VKRRHFIAFLGAAMGANFFDSALAQQGRPTRHVGFLYFGSRESAIATGRYKAFLDGMREQGYVAGRDFTLEERFAAGNTETLGAAAQDLVRLKVDLIVATGSQAVRAAQKATSDVPIVVTQIADPIGEGFAVSLVRPGRNITGMYSSSLEIVSKQIELFQLLLPNLSLMAVLGNPSNGSYRAALKAAESFAAQTQVKIQSLQARTQDDIERAFEDMARQRPQALLIFADTFLLSQAPQISELAIKRRLPIMGWTREFAAAGGLMSYGQDAIDNFRLAAGYVTKIFRGAKPAELPFSRTPKVSLTINRRTFRALGLTLSREIESRVDEVIE
jgi:putative ABC transport system substrate-binding protein